MEFKGTPGKWKVWRNQIDDTPIIGAVNGTSLFIVSKSSETSIYHYDANALLVSKAPEMLQALINFVTALDQNKNILAEEYEIAKQVIKEATEV
jgi:hypothetical protein